MGKKNNDDVVVAVSGVAAIYSSIIRAIISRVNFVVHECRATQATPIPFNPSQPGERENIFSTKSIADDAWHT